MAAPLGFKPADHGEDHDDLVDRLNAADGDMRSRRRSDESASGPAPDIRNWCQADATGGDALGYCRLEGCGEHVVLGAFRVGAPTPICATLSERRASPARRVGNVRLPVWS